jgi:hypothetical protein
MTKTIVSLQSPREGLTAGDEELLAQARENFQATLAQKQAQFKELSPEREKILRGRDPQLFFPWKYDEVASPENISKLPEGTKSWILWIQGMQDEIAREGEGLNAALELLSRPRGADIIAGVEQIHPRGLMNLYAYLEDAVGREVEAGSGSPFMRELVGRVRERRKTMPEERDPRSDLNIYDAYAVDEFRRWLEAEFQRDLKGLEPGSTAYNAINTRVDRIRAIVRTNKPDGTLQTRKDIMDGVASLGERTLLYFRGLAHKGVYEVGLGEVWPGEKGYRRTILNDVYDIIESRYRRIHLIQTSEDTSL